MSEYIEREAAVAKITELINQSGKYTDYECGADDACYIVNHIQAADVQPVVACADCKHWKRIKKDCILASCDLDALVRCEDFYCANGEKREES